VALLTPDPAVNADYRLSVLQATAPEDAAAEVMQAIDLPAIQPDSN
jgi:hypothetical protein